MAWNVETLKSAVAEVVGEDTAAVSWGDSDGNAVSRRSWKGRPPKLVVGAALHGDDMEERLRELPGFVRLSGRDEEDYDGDPYRVVRAVFTRTW